MINNSDPVSITITLDTEVVDPELDPETGEYVGPGDTIRDLIVESAVTRLVAQTIKDVRKDVSAKIIVVAQTEISDQVRTMVAEVLAEPFQVTDHWGHKAGTPTTVRQRVAEEIAEQLKKSDSRGYNAKNTVITDVIKEEVHGALTRELKTAVQEAREKVVGAVKERAAEIIADSVRAGLKL